MAADYALLGDVIPRWVHEGHIQHCVRKPKVSDESAVIIMCIRKIDK